MKITKKESGDKERRTLIAMITDPTVCGRVASKWDGQLFSSKWANTVAQWCVDHYDRHGEPPGKGVEALFESWSESAPDPREVGAVEDFLADLSKEYETAAEINPGLVIDQAGEYFDRVRLNRLKDKLEADLAAGKIAKAKERVAAHVSVEMGATAGVDLFVDREAVKAALSPNRRESLVELPGALGQLFGGRLARDSLIAFLAGEKVGKSWWLSYIAYEAMLQRRKVAFFAVGDESEDEIAERLLIRAAKRPFMSPRNAWPYEVQYPTKIEPAEKVARVTREVRVFDKPLTFRDAWQACERVMAKQVKSGRSYFKLASHPSLGIGVAGIEAQLRIWQQQDDFNADVVVIDYADNLAPPLGKREEQDQINATWQLMKGLAQRRHCLVLTATQANAEAATKRTLDRTNFSRDKRKLAHVNAMFGINMTPKEKEEQVYRINCILGRRGEYSARRCVCTAACLALGNPAVRACWE